MVLLDPSSTAQNGMEYVMLNFLLWLVFGALVGWLTGIVMQAKGNRGLVLHVVVGMIGSVIGGLTFDALYAYGPIVSEYGLNLRALGASYGGAVILLTGMTLVQRVQIQYL